MVIAAFSDLSITIAKTDTIPSFKILNEETFVNIGSGNVLKVCWNTPTAFNNIVDSYKVHVLIQDTISAGYIPLYSVNVGNVNEFYLKSSLFDGIDQTRYILNIYVEVISKHGDAYNGISNVATVTVFKGTGSYVRVETANTQPVMKRALAFARLGYKQLIDSKGKALVDANGRTLYTKILPAQTTDGWALMREFYSKDLDGNWSASDIRYEVLTDTTGELILDSNDTPIYTL